MSELKDKIQKAVDFIRTQCDITPKFAVVLGTGLDGFAKQVDVKATIPYEKIPNFPRTTTAHHTGNLVLGVFRNDFAIRMLEASVPSGIEAPLRFYLTENADGTATLTYRTPSAVFAPYGSAALDEMARELDAIWARIVQDAIGP